MLMFRFWNSEHRGSDKTLQTDRPMLDIAKPVRSYIAADASPPGHSPTSPSKQRSQSSDTIAPQPASVAAALSAGVKRPRSGEDASSHGHGHVSHPQKKVALAAAIGPVAPAPAPAPAPLCNSSHAHAPVATAIINTAPLSGTVDTERAREAIEQQFSLEILLKHDEMRLINQEFAKCQVALEQLRRCHLIPYPLNTPTPEQMLNVAHGSGPALQPKPGEELARWAPPFGVIDGPYARHYAKWLIPDPKFDGVEPELPLHGDGWRTRSAVEGRSTRNTVMDPNSAQAKGRPSRGYPGQKLQALTGGFPMPKDKTGPCVLRRSDGQTVKLVCIDCHRENFSSTQGFINHCRIAHKRDFKSHEEAAVHCGHPIEASEAPSKAAAVEEKKAGGFGVATSVVPPGLVHPFTRADAMTESEACFSVVRRIQQSLDLYRQGKLPGVSAISATPEKRSRVSASDSAPGFSPCTDSPNLSRLLHSRGFTGNLGAIVQEAKTKIEPDQSACPSDDESDQETSTTPVVGRQARLASSHATTTMRVPTRATMAPAVSASRLSASEESFLGHDAMAYAPPVPPPTPQLATVPRRELVMDEDMVDVTELSPNTAVSNNAPSLVSDDGEYDDSADSDTASEIDVSIGTETIPDVDEIDIDDEHTDAPPLRHHGSTGSGARTRVRLVKSDSKHVTFVASLTEKEKVQQGHRHGINISTIH
ncbi:hypothetical protein F5Y17DRAFT_199330 [Xylariaceae sp. FL0594]|nr:hypothetical protein F5Y17DRAFT_199330 [Xylariaceae sp. FL0594]